MIAVIFEVLPCDEQRQAYLDAAERLRPHLADIDGFISIERFQSLAQFLGVAVPKILRCG